MNIRRESIRVLKKKVINLLKNPDIEPGLDELSMLPAVKVVNTLFSLLYDKDPVIKWHAVTAMGLIVAEIAGREMEAARVIIRRLMWNLNDESGGIGWGSAEALGEILAVNETLAPEYSGILLSYAREDGNFQEHLMMQRGVLWGIYRLSGNSPNLLKDVAPPYIMPYLNSPDTTVRSLAILITGAINVRRAGSELKKLIDDNNHVLIYLDREFKEFTVKDLALQALKKIEQGN